MMQERGMKIPLLIGGATTSRVHTAVKIDPVYDGTVVHVVDAQSVPVASNLLSEDLHDDFVADIKENYDKVRENHANKHILKLLCPSKRLVKELQKSIGLSSKLRNQAHWCESIRRHRT